MVSYILERMKQNKKNRNFARAVLLLRQTARGIIIFGEAPKGRIFDDV